MHGAKGAIVRAAQESRAIVPPLNGNGIYVWCISRKAKIDTSKSESYAGRKLQLG